MEAVDAGQAGMVYRWQVKEMVKKISGDEEHVFTRESLNNISSKYEV
jgi:hypothetical protein